MTPLRTELPIDEAADAIGVARDDLRAYVAEGPFRSGRRSTSSGCGWPDVIAWDNERREERSAAFQEMLNKDPWDEPEADGRTS